MHSLRGLLKGQDFDLDGELARCGELAKLGHSVEGSPNGMSGHGLAGERLLDPLRGR
jgi:hypothetical protein